MSSPINPSMGHPKFAGVENTAPPLLPTNTQWNTVKLGQIYYQLDNIIDTLSNNICVNDGGNQNLLNYYCSMAHLLVSSSLTQPTSSDPSYPQYQQLQKIVSAGTNAQAIQNTFRVNDPAYTANLPLRSDQPGYADAMSELGYFNSLGFEEFFHQALSTVYETHDLSQMSHFMDLVASDSQAFDSNELNLPNFPPNSNPLTNGTPSVLDQFSVVQTLIGSLKPTSTNPNVYPPQYDIIMNLAARLLLFHTPTPCLDSPGQLYPTKPTYFLNYVNTLQTSWSKNTPTEEMASNQLDGLLSYFVYTSAYLQKEGECDGNTFNNLLGVMVNMLQSFSKASSMSDWIEEASKDISSINSIVNQTTFGLPQSQDAPYQRGVEIPPSPPNYNDVTLRFPYPPNY